MARTGTLDTLLTPRANTVSWSGGVASDSWASGTAFWAEVREQAATEALRAGALDAARPVLVTYRTDDATLSASMQLTDGSVTYEVRSAPAAAKGPRGLYSYVLATADPSE